jgi:hypothetical protein
MWTRWSIAGGAGATHQGVGLVLKTEQLGHWDLVWRGQSHHQGGLGLGLGLKTQRLGR